MSELNGEWRRGWPVVLAAGFGYGLATIHIPSLGAMITPLSTSFGWSRGEITGAMMFLGLTGVLLNPFVGKLVERVGARKVALLAIWLYAATLGAIGLSGPALWTWYLTWGLLALIYPLICPLVWTTPVVNRFDKHRGMALGLMLCGSGIGSTLIPTFTVWATDVFGWRGAYFALAALAIGLMFPFTWFFFKDSEAKSRLASVEASAPRGGLTVGEAVRKYRFWSLLIALTLSAGIASGIQVHLQPMFTDGGVTAIRAAAMFSAMGPALILGRMGVGILLDRVPGPIVAGVILALPAASMALMLNYDGSVWRGTLAAGLLGLAYGAEVDLMGYLTSRYFGLKNYSTIFGIILGCLTLGYGITPPVIGYVFDVLGSYRNLLLVMIPLALLTAVMIGTLGRYPPDWDPDR